MPVAIFYSNNALYTLAIISRFQGKLLHLAPGPAHQALFSGRPRLCPLLIKNWMDDLRNTIRLPSNKESFTPAPGHKPFEFNMTRFREKNYGFPPLNFARDGISP